MRVSRRKYCRVVSGLLHSTKDRRSSLSFCRLSFKTSVGITKLSLISVGSMSTTVSRVHGEAEDITHMAACNPWHMSKLQPSAAISRCQCNNHNLPNLIVPRSELAVVPYMKTDLQICHSVCLGLRCVSGAVHSGIHWLPCPSRLCRSGG